MLTDEQIDTVTDAQWGIQAVSGMYLAYRAYARAIEAETLKAHQQAIEAAVLAWQVKNVHCWNNSAYDNAAKVLTNCGIQPKGENNEL